MFTVIMVLFDVFSITFVVYCSALQPPSGLEWKSLLYLSLGRCQPANLPNLHSSFDRCGNVAD